MLLNIKDLKNKSFSFQKNEDVFVYEIKFEGTELKELESLINQLKNSPLIKEIDWV